MAWCAVAPVVSTSSTRITVLPATFSGAGSKNSPCRGESSLKIDEPLGSSKMGLARGRKEADEGFYYRESEELSCDRCDFLGLVEASLPRCRVGCAGTGTRTVFARLPMRSSFSIASAIILPIGLRSQSCRWYLRRWIISLATPRLWYCEVAKSNARSRLLQFEH